MTPMRVILVYPTWSGCWSFRLEKQEGMVPAEHEIRADFDRETLVIYQAYSPAIADAALKAKRFVPPFSFHRMTWIKPSFLWLMHRSNWGQKSGQERVLAVRLKLTGWEKALSLAVLTSFEPSVFHSPEEWREQFQHARVHLQWDPERSLRGAGLPYYSIQVGLSRHIIREYVEEWITGIEDFTPRFGRSTISFSGARQTRPSDSCRPSAFTR